MLEKTGTSRIVSLHRFVRSLSEEEKIAVISQDKIGIPKRIRGESLNGHWKKIHCEDQGPQIQTFPQSYLKHGLERPSSSQTPKLFQFFSTHSIQELIICGKTTKHRLSGCQKVRSIAFLRSFLKKNPQSFLIRRGSPHDSLSPTEAFSSLKSRQK
jgi:hypothetical protein